MFTLIVLILLVRALFRPRWYLFRPWGMFGGFGGGHRPPMGGFGPGPRGFGPGPYGMGRRGW